MDVPWVLSVEVIKQSVFLPPDETRQKDPSRVLFCFVSTVGGRSLRYRLDDYTQLQLNSGAETVTMGQVEQQQILDLVLAEELWQSNDPEDSALVDALGEIEEEELCLFRDPVRD